MAALIDEFHILLLKEFYEYPLLHILAQLTNIIAQNKIGSGFDISTSLFGSQNYTRFPESLIPKELIENINNNKYSIIFKYTVYIYF